LLALMLGLSILLVSNSSIKFSKETSPYKLKNNLNSSELVSFKASTKENKYVLNISKKIHKFSPGISTNVLSYNNVVPGPLISGNKGEEITVKVYNNMDEPTTVHWHGLQVDNDQDGVPDITQKKIMPGDSMLYTLKLKNPGTYWYHSHFDGHKQVESGLNGPLIVYDENEEIFHDEIILMFDDVLLDNYNQFRDFDLGKMHGRFGNILLLNGVYNPTLNSNGGNVRIRLINSANARTFFLSFGNRIVSVIGEDIGRTNPYNVSLLRISPGERFDILIKADNEKIPIYQNTNRGKVQLGEIIFTNINQNLNLNNNNIKIKFMMMTIIKTLI